MADTHLRVQERPPDSKPFAVNYDDLAGASKTELYLSDYDYKVAKEGHDMCMLYATAYNQTMLKRLAAERPDFFEENNISKDELATHLTNNMCLPFTKYKNRVFRDTTARFKEKEHLTD